MLDSALEGFSETPDRDRYLIVLSDGESSVEGWESRLDPMAKRDIHVLSIGVGTDKGAFVPDQQGGYRVERRWRRRPFAAHAGDVAGARRSARTACT